MSSTCSTIAYSPLNVSGAGVAIVSGGAWRKILKCWICEGQHQKTCRWCTEPRMKLHSGTQALPSRSLTPKWLPQEGRALQHQRSQRLTNAAPWKHDYARNHSAADHDGTTSSGNIDTSYAYHHESCLWFSHGKIRFYLNGLSNGLHVWLLLSS